MYIHSSFLRYINLYKASHGYTTKTQSGNK